jgi:hypothetical protein
MIREPWDTPDNVARAKPDRASRSVKNPQNAGIHAISGLPQNGYPFLVGGPHPGLFLEIMVHGGYDFVPGFSGWTGTRALLKETKMFRLAVRLAHLAVLCATATLGACESAATPPTTTTTPRGTPVGDTPFRVSGSIQSGASTTLR